MRKEVLNLLALGQMLSYNEEDISDSHYDEFKIQEKLIWEVVLSSEEEPLTENEAISLVYNLGEDDTSDPISSLIDVITTAKIINKSVLLTSLKKNSLLIDLKRDFLLEGVKYPYYSHGNLVWLGYDWEEIMSHLKTPISIQDFKFLTAVNACHFIYDKEGLQEYDVLYLKRLKEIIIESNIDLSGLSEFELNIYDLFTSPWFQ